MVANWTTVQERVLSAPIHWGKKTQTNLDLKNQLYWGIIVRQWNSLILSTIWFLLKNVYNFDSLITIALSFLEYGINSNTVLKKRNLPLFLFVSFPPYGIFSNSNIWPLSIFFLCWVSDPVGKHNYHHLSISLILLEYNCFTTLCYFLLYNSVNQLYVYIHPLPLEPASHPLHPTTEVIAEHWTELPL